MWKLAWDCLDFLGTYAEYAGESICLWGANWLTEAWSRQKTVGNTGFKSWLCHWRAVIWNKLLHFSELQLSPLHVRVNNIPLGAFFWGLTEIMHEVPMPHTWQTLFLLHKPWKQTLPAGGFAAFWLASLCSVFIKYWAWKNPSWLQMKALELPLPEDEGTVSPTSPDKYNN